MLPNRLLTPRNVIAGILAISLILAIVEQLRIQHDSQIPVAVRFVSTDGNGAGGAGENGSYHFESAADRIECRFSDPKMRVRRVKVALVYGFTGARCLTIAVHTNSGIARHYPCQGVLSPMPGSDDPALFEWQETIVTPPGAFKLDIHGEPGLSVNIQRLTAKTERSIASGPDFSHRLAWLLIAIGLSLPIYWRLHRHPVVAQWYLVGLSAFILFVVEPLFAVVLLVLLTIIFRFKRSLSVGSHRRPMLFTALLLTCVVFLCIFKYAPHWFYGLFVTLPGQYVGLPIGISYFVFRIMHLIMEWYRGRFLNLCFREYLCFLTFFPTIPAGPIETVEGFYQNRLVHLDWEAAGNAMTRILFGLFKKVVLVSMILSPVIFTPDSGFFDRVTAGPAEVGYPLIVVTLCSFLLYAYLDLSAYSDIAIGLGLLFGHRIRENFNLPILKPNIAEFWRSYHMSLADWCRNNVYFPVLMLTRTTPLALYLSMLTMGIWHHINLNWTFWGLHHGSGLVWIMILSELMHRHFRKVHPPRPVMLLWRPVRTSLTFLFVAGGTALVFIDDIQTALVVYFRFFTLH